MCSVQCAGVDDGLIIYPPFPSLCYHVVQWSQLEYHTYVPTYPGRHLYAYAVTYLCESSSGSAGSEIPTLLDVDVMS